MHNDWLTDDDLIDNPSPRIPVCLCIDVSRSMSYHDSMKLLKEGLNTFYDQIKEDHQVANSAEIAIVTFGNEAEVEENFSLVNKKMLPELKTGGNTVLGTGVLKGLEILEERKNMYKDNGLDYYQPWLLIMTDGASYGESKTILHKAQDQARELEHSKKLVVIPISIGSKAKVDELQKFTSKPNNVTNVNTTDFSKFFEFISKSVGQVVHSEGEVTLDIDLSQVSDWGNI